MNITKNIKNYKIFALLIFNFFIVLLIAPLPIFFLQLIRYLKKTVKYFIENILCQKIVKKLNLNINLKFDLKRKKVYKN